MKAFNNWRQKMIDGSADINETILWVILLIMLLSMVSCTSSRISSKPTRREMNRAMKYSTSDYKMPSVQVNIAQWYDPRQ